MTMNLFIGNFHNSLEDMYRSKSSESLRRSIMHIKAAMQNPRQMRDDGTDGNITFAKRIEMIEGILKERGEA